jgi:hypothetical protein
MAGARLPKHSPRLVSRLLGMMVLVMVVVMMVRGRVRGFLGGGDAGQEQTGADHQCSENVLHGDIPESVRSIAAENTPRDYHKGRILAFA